MIYTNNRTQAGGWSCQPYQREVSLHEATRILLGLDLLSGGTLTEKCHVDGDKSQIQSTSSVYGSVDVNTFVGSEEEVRFLLELAAFVLGSREENRDAIADCVISATSTSRSLRKPFVATTLFGFLQGDSIGCMLPYFFAVKAAGIDFSLDNSHEAFKEAFKELPKRSWEHALDAYFVSLDDEHDGFLSYYALEDMYASKRKSLAAA